MTNLYKNNSGFISITTFAISIFIVLGVLTFSYGFYENSKTSSKESISQTEILNSIISFRGQILTIQNLENSTLYYNSKLDSPQIKIKLTPNKIIGSTIHNLILIEKSIPSLVTFCSNYTFNPNTKTTFHNSGTCVKKIN